MKTNDLSNKTLEEIENDYWGTAPSDESYLVKTMYSLRQKKIKEFTIEDLRILISQDRALDLLIPIAIDVLDDNLFAEGDFYPGDLLKSVLTSKNDFWEKNQLLKDKVVDLYNRNIEHKYDENVTENIRLRISDAFEKFK